MFAVNNALKPVESARLVRAFPGGGGWARLRQPPFQTNAIRSAHPGGAPGKHSATGVYSCAKHHKG